MIKAAYTGLAPNRGEWKAFEDWISEYGPKDAKKLVVIVNSEYNDEWYNYSTRAGVFFDADGNEMALKNSIEALSELPDLPSRYSNGSYGCGGEEEIDQITLELE